MTLLAKARGCPASAILHSAFAFLAVILTPVASGALSAQGEKAEPEAVLTSLLAANPVRMPVHGDLHIRSMLPGSLDDTFGAALLPAVPGSQGAFGVGGHKPREYTLRFRTGDATRWYVRIVSRGPLGEMLGESSSDGTDIWVRPFVRYRDGDRWYEKADLLYKAPAQSIQVSPASLWSFGYGRGLTPGQVLREIAERAKWGEVSQRVVLGQKKSVVRGKPKPDAWADAVQGLRPILAQVASIEIQYDAASMALLGFSFFGAANEEFLSAEFVGVVAPSDLPQTLYGFPGAPGEKSLDLIPLLLQRKILDAADPAASVPTAATVQSSASVASGPLGPCVHLRMLPKHQEGHLRSRPCPVCDYNNKINEKWAAVQTDMPVQEWMVCKTNHELLKEPVPCEHFTARPEHDSGDPADAGGMPLLAAMAAEWALLDDKPTEEAQAREQYFFESLVKLDPPSQLRVLETLEGHAARKRAEREVRGQAPIAQNLDPISNMELKLVSVLARIGAKGRDLRSKLLDRVADGLDGLHDSQRFPVLHELLLGDPSAVSDNLPLVVSQLSLAMEDARTEAFIRGPVDKVSASIIWEKALSAETLIELQLAARDARVPTVRQWAQNVLKDSDVAAATRLRQERLGADRERAQNMLCGKWRTGANSGQHSAVNIDLVGTEFVATVVQAGPDLQRNGMENGHVLFRVEWAPTDDHPALAKLFYMSQDRRQIGPITRKELQNYVAKNVITDSTLVRRTDAPANQPWEPFSTRRLAVLPEGRFFKGTYHPGGGEASRRLRDRGMESQENRGLLRAWLLKNGDAWEIQPRTGSAPFTHMRLERGELNTRQGRKQGRERLRVGR